MKINKFIIILVLISLYSGFVFPQTKKVSFSQQNKNSKYISFSFGMGVNYGDNSSLVNFVGYELPFYNTLSPADKLSNFSAGFEGFAGVEFQIKKSYSIKVEYSYFSKSISLTSLAQYQNYEFNYVSHQPFITAFYIIPQEYSYIKLGFGAGFIHSIFTTKIYNAGIDYSSNGIGLKLNAILDVQISKNLAGYIEGYINKSFQGNLKDDSGNLLISRNGDNVNLNIFGLGMRLGAEFIIF